MELECLKKNITRQFSFVVQSFILGVEILDKQLLSLFSDQGTLLWTFFDDSYPHVWDFVAREVVLLDLV